MKTILLVASVVPYLLLGALADKDWVKRTFAPTNAAVVAEAAAETNIQQSAAITGLQSSVTGLQSSVTGLQSSVTGLQSSVTGMQSSKQDVISDLSSIRSGSEAGATAVQPAAISDMASKTWVGQQGFATSQSVAGGYLATSSPFLGPGTINWTDSTYNLEVSGTMHVGGILKADGIVTDGTITLFSENGWSSLYSLYFEQTLPQYLASTAWHGSNKSLSDYGITDAIQAKSGVVIANNRIKLDGTTGTEVDIDALGQRITVGIQASPVAWWDYYCAWNRGTRQHLPDYLASTAWHGTNKSLSDYGITNEVSVSASGPSFWDPGLSVTWKMFCTNGSFYVSAITNVNVTGVQ